MQTITYKPIGIIQTPFKKAQGVPIQSAATDAVGRVEIFPEYLEGLDDLAGFSHVMLFYHFHQSKKYSLKVKPFLDDEFRGVFATRAPSRPNSIGISVVKLLKIDKGMIQIQKVDIIDGTPLLDIKPYIPKFDVWDVSATGWIENRADSAESVEDDGRFSG